MKKVISAVPGGPSSSAAYSLAVLAEGRFLFVTGQGPYDPKTDKKERGTIERQTELALANLKSIIEASGARLADVVSCRVYLQPLDHQTFEQMNRAYTRFWGSQPPARTTIGCQLLDMDVEIDCIVAVA